MLTTLFLVSFILFQLVLQWRSFNFVLYIRTQGNWSETKVFICDEIRPIDNQPYSEGGLATCELDKSKERLKERKLKVESFRDHRFHEATQGYFLLHAGQSFDTFAILLPRRKLKTCGMISNIRFEKELLEGRMLSCCTTYFNISKICDSLQFPGKSVRL